MFNLFLPVRQDAQGASNAAMWAHFLLNLPRIYQGSSKAQHYLPKLQGKH